MISVGGPFTYENSRFKEWLVANGLGGYASSTVTGANTRKYHGLLISSKNPPVDRRLLVSKLEETVDVFGRELSLSTNRYPGAVYPKGFENLSSFSLSPLPCFDYSVGGSHVKKTVFMVHGRNATVVRYELDSNEPLEISVAPLVNDRDFHSNTNGRINFSQEPKKHGTRIKNENSASILLESDILSFSKSESWYENMVYDIETERGEGDRDNHFCPGLFSGRFSGKAVFHITMSDGEAVAGTPEALYGAELARLSGLNGTGKNVPEHLIYSADSFRAFRKSTSSSTIIAGYPWFADWGRDSMISIPGLALELGEFGFARSVLETFAQNIRGGLVPNVFSDAGIGASYNSADSSLWFILSSYRYLKKTGDLLFVRERLWDRIKEIISSYKRGTGGVRMDSDCLVSCGPGLTWMDAFVGGKAVTARAGKPVEVNALWYNALEIAREIADELGERSLAVEYAELSAGAKKSFLGFWNESKECLFDVIEPNDSSVRPNQVIAISLPFRLLDKSMELSILEVAGRELLTPYGLRSLSQKEPGYLARYSGDRMERDSAYHNGAVWSWLIGPYADAIANVMGGKKAALKLVKPLKEFIGEQGMGTVPELFEAESLEPKGCFSQAWGVAEWLRVISEYG